MGPADDSDRTPEEPEPGDPADPGADRGTADAGLPGVAAAVNGSSVNGSGTTGHEASPGQLWDASAWTPAGGLSTLPAAPGMTLPATAGAVPADRASAWPPAPPTGRRPIAAPSPPRTHRWGLGAYLLVEVVFLGVSLVLQLAIGGDGTDTSAGVLALQLAVPTVLAAAVAVVATWVRGNGPRIDLGLVWSWRDVGVGLAFGLGALVITIPASALFVAIAGDDSNSAVGEVFGNVRTSLPMALLVFAIVVFVAPLCEEIMYRGLLWGGVLRLGARPWLTFGITTLLFALAHFEFARTPLLLVVAIPIGLARLYTGRLLSSIVAHQVNNLLPGIVLLLGLLGVVPGA